MLCRTTCPSLRRYYSEDAYSEGARTSHEGSDTRVLLTLHGPLDISESSLFQWGEHDKGFLRCYAARMQGEAEGNGSDGVTQHPATHNETKDGGRVGGLVWLASGSHVFFFLFRQLARQGVGIGCQLCVSADEAQAHSRRRRAAHAAQKDINPGWVPHDGGRGCIVVSWPACHRRRGICADRGGGWAPMCVS